MDIWANIGSRHGDAHDMVIHIAMYCLSFSKNIFPHISNLSTMLRAFLQHSFLFLWSSLYL